MGVIHRHAVTKMRSSGRAHGWHGGCSHRFHEELPELQRAGGVPLATALVRTPLRLDWPPSLPVRELRDALRHP
jgi:hypothetical protein